MWERPKERRIGFLVRKKNRLYRGFFESNKSGRQYAKDAELDYGCFCRWLKAYHEEGRDGLASHRNRCGNRYAALHISKNLNALGQLQLRMAKVEADVARLKKDTR